MKSIEARFRLEQDKSPLHSSLICFLRSVKGQHLTADAISRMFTKLVDKNDYESRDRQRLIVLLASVSSNLAEDH